MGNAMQFRRKLTTPDLERMHLPKKFWKVNSAGISDESIEGFSPREVAVRYVDNMDEMWAKGIGMLLYGTNGRGKSGFAACIAKEYRRRGYTVLWVEAADLKRLVIANEHFDEDETVWERAFGVDVLVIDDFGKGINDTTGFGVRLFDELIRGRNGRNLISFITTNGHPDDMREELDLLASTMASLQEHIVPLEITGPDLREDVNDDVSEMLTGLTAR